MAPNGTSTTLPLPVENTSPHLKSPMDTVDAPTNDRAPVSSATSSASPPLPLGPIVPMQRPANYWPMLNLKREADRRKTYESWPVPFMDPHRLSAAGFYYVNQGDVVRCVFCGVEVGHWEEGDDPFRDHQRWAASCGFVRGLQVGNIPVSQDWLPEGPLTQEASRSYDVCGPYMEFRPNSGPERAVSSGLNHNLLTPEELQKHGINQSRGPLHPSYNTYDARVRSFESWPRSLRQKPDKLSEAGFYYTGKGDQTVCFHCGGGLKDWEETDDPWVEHAVWFPKCIHVILIKGRAFIEECRRLKEARTPVQDAKDPLGDVQKTETSPSSAQCKVETPASASTTQGNVSEERVIDDARVCQICFMEERGVVFLPCGHLVACVKCAPSLSTCAVCRQPFTGTVRAFLS